ncbi:ribonuclease H-like domain-containing protein [Tanacetum coccineum]
MESQSETIQTMSALKLLVLKTGEYDLWSMMMKQYLTFTDHTLWEVIVNGDPVSPIASASAGAEGPIPPKTTKQKLARKNELKAKSTLMLAYPDEHLLKFHACKDAKSLWEAIKNRFGGNKDSKKMQKTILKQNYENFAASSQEGLDKTFDRFQNLISQLEIHGEVISQEDANLKLLRSLPSAWNNIALIMRNKSDLDTLSMDDLYKNLKVYESEMKVQSSSSSNSQNVAFVSSDNSSSTNETVNTVHSVSAASSKDQASTASYADDVMFSFFSNQSNAPQLDNEDLEQIDADDIEEMDLKWQVAMLTIRVKRFIKKTGRKLDLNDKETVGFDRTKVECYNCHRRDTSTTNALVVQDGIGCYDWRFQAKEGLTNFALMAYTSQGLESLEARIVVHEKNEVVYEENIAFLKYDVQVKDISIKELKNQLENALKEKDDLKLKLENFEESSKNLTKLINSQIRAKDKTSLGYDGQKNESELNNIHMNESELNNIHMNESEVVHSVFNSRDSDVDDNPINDRFKTCEGFHAVPPPYTGNYMPPRPDLSFAGLDDSVFKSKESDSEDENVFKPKEAKKMVKPSFEKIEFINARNLTVEKPRKFSQSPRDNKRNWNGLMTQRLGDDFEFKKKACFVCGSFNHLIKDCDFHDNKMVEKLVLNKKGRITGQREIRPVWNNAQRVNHQNELTHPHPKRNFVPTEVATMSGQVPVNVAKQSSHRAAISISAARRVNTAAPRPNVNDALPTTYSYFKAHSPVSRPFNQKSAVKTNNFYKKINTARVNNVTTVGQKVVVRTGEENRDNVVKSSACWIWRPKGNLIDHISKDCGSYTPKRFDYVDPQGKLKSIMAWDQGMFDSGCSRHMTGNKFYLSDYQEIDGGFVAFGESPKRGKITGKGKIKTRKLDFEDVYFVKELKFNLFSVSQMCDKKNSVLFTKTECLILSPNFKLLDESQVLLKVPRHNNMYSFNLKNVVLLGGGWDGGVRRCDNGTEFKNNDMNQFCKIKWIKRKFSVARTSQQNGVAEEKNRTLIEAARTMLADSLLPTTFWAEAVNTACYVQNRVLVTKPHNKTPYELLLSRPPSISFMRLFRCPMTILNTLDPLGKFDGKADEGFLVRYSINSKAFRVFNTKTRKVEENLHINFLENKPNVAGSGPEWLFDIDSLTKSMNYEPVTAGNQTNSDADNKDADEVPGKGDDDLSERNGQEKEVGASNNEDDQHVQDFKAELDYLLVHQKEGYANNTNRVSTVNLPVNTASITTRNFHQCNYPFIKLDAL